MIYIENEGALFRGTARTLPLEVWNSESRAWRSYQAQEDKPIEWGYLIEEAEAHLIMFGGKLDFGTPYPPPAPRRPRGAPRAGVHRRSIGKWV